MLAALPESRQIEGLHLAAGANPVQMVRLLIELAPHAFRGLALAAKGLADTWHREGRCDDLPLALLHALPAYGIESLFNEIA